MTDGFDHEDDGVGRMALIQGLRLKCDVTKSPAWQNPDGSPITDVFAAIDTRTLHQRWQNNRVIESIEKIPSQPWPKLDDLNAAIAQSEWERGPNGLKPPWQTCHVVYLLKLSTSEKYTFTGTSIGARRAVSDLRDAIHTRRQLQGAHVIAMVRLETLPMKTQYGMKLRPYFKPINWLMPDGSRAPQLGAPPPMLENKSAPTNTANDLDDQIPF
jgi:hypothetical protein